MCFNISITQLMELIEERFNAKFSDRTRYKPVYHASGFSTPHMPVISSENPGEIEFYQWGLIPHWVKDEQRAVSLSKRTLNAKAETIFEKPSFRSVIRSQRCLVIVDGFFEWREVSKKKYPYYIKMTDHSIFTLAGIWDRWVNPETDETLYSFSIITTEANPLLAKIHNTKKRMPVILSGEEEERWLSEELEKDDIEQMLDPYDGEDFTAYTVSKLITTKGADKNVPEIQEKYEYDELKSEQLSLF